MATRRARWTRSRSPRPRSSLRSFRNAGSGTWRARWSPWRPRRCPASTRRTATCSTPKKPRARCTTRSTGWSPRWFGSSRNTACPWTRRPRRNAKRTSTSTRHPLKTSRTRQVGPSKRLRFAPSAARPKSIPKKNRRRRGPRSASIRGSRTYDRGSWTFRRWMRRRSPPRRRTSRPRE